MNIVAHNIFAMNASRQLGIATKSKAKSTEKLSSGYKINRAADDAAGLSISEKMRRQIRGLTQGVANTQDGVSLCQVADGALTEVHEMLHRITELSVQSANDTNTDSDRDAIQMEINEILQEINRIGETTTFNERNIFSTPSSNNPIDKINSIRSSIHVNGSPTDFAITDYNFTSNGTNGIKVNGTTINFSDMKKADNTALTDSITIGTYNFSYNGLDFSFSVTNDDITLAQISEAFGDIPIHMDAIGTEIQAMTSVDVRLGYLMGTGHFAFANDPDITPHTITADENGIYIDKGTKYESTVHWTDPHWGWGNIPEQETYEEYMQSGKDLSVMRICFPNLGIYIQGINANGTDKATMIAGINGTTFETEFTGLGADWYHENISIFTSENLSIKIKDPDKCATLYGANSPKEVLDDSFKGTYIDDGTKLSLQYVLNGTITRSIDFSDAEYKAYKEFVAGNNDELTLHGSDDIFDFDFSYKGDGFDFNGQTLVGDVYSGYRVKNIELNSMENGNFISSSKSASFDYSGIKRIPSGDSALALWIQSGCDAGDGMFLEIDGMNTDILGISDLDVSTTDGADKAIAVMDEALQKISANRSKIGAQQNRLEHTIANQENVVENTTAAESIIRDTDMALEMVKFSKDSILEQVGQSILAQANQSTQGVLSLLQA